MRCMGKIAECVTWEMFALLLPANTELAEEMSRSPFNPS